MPVLVKGAMGLFVVAAVVILGSVGWDAYWLVVAWGVAALVLAFGARVVRGPLARVALCATLIPLCVLLTFEGGLFFLPAAVVLLLAAVQEWRRGRCVPA
jgi:hypothetical protein